MRLEENNFNEPPKMWPLFEYDEDEKEPSKKMKAILGYVEHLKDGFYRVYDSQGEEVTIVDRKGILIQAIQAEAEELLKQLWSSEQNG